ncbi:hypothetical protein [Neobacillus drentensis]|uniref:hypothetical protein n=1 Tax=Neobacillus drentensis TaxID=220684 RepID=UPI002FFF4185
MTTILIELDKQTRSNHLNQMEKWFEHVLTIQMSLENSLQRAIPIISEPHMKEAIQKTQAAVRAHSSAAEDLFKAIHRSADAAKDRALANINTAVQTGLFSFEDLMGGAVGSWKEIHLLLLMNQQAMGAFAVAEQLGLAIGMKEVVNIAFPVVHEKTMHQLLLQEYMLEMAPVSILYQENV